MAQKNDGKDFEQKAATIAAKANNNKQLKMKREWRVGDFARAKYPGEDKWFEVKIDSIDGDQCEVDFLGFGEKAKVDLTALNFTQKKLVMRHGKRTFVTRDDDETSSEDDTDDDDDDDVPDNSVNTTGEVRKNSESHTSHQSNNDTTAAGEFPLIYTPMDEWERTIGRRYNKNYSKKPILWRVGDHARAKYYGDNRWYEVKIVSIDGNMCTVDFLGYDDEIEMKLSCLDKSHGKEVIKKQVEYARRHAVESDDDESASDDDERDDHSHRHRRHSGRGHHKNSKAHMFDQSNNFSGAESSILSGYPVGRFPMPPAMPPVMPNMPGPLLDASHDPVLSAMLYYWNAAGYYTALYKAQCSSRQQCCHCVHARRL